MSADSRVSAQPHHRPELGCRRLAMAIAWKAARLGAGKLVARGVPDLTGGILFQFESPKGGLELLWHAGEGKKIGDIPGAFSILNLGDYHIEKPLMSAVKPALEAALAREDFSIFAPPVRRLVAGLSSLADGWLVPEQTGWFAYTLRDVVRTTGGLECRFATQERTLRVVLAPAQADAPPSPSEIVRVDGVVATILDDTRSAEEREAVPHQIERLFAFILNRVSFEDAQAGSRTAVEAGDVRGRLRRGGVPLENVFNLATDQSWRQFMAEGDTMHFLGISTQPSACNAYVWHSDKSCFHMRPSLHGRLARLIEYPWPFDASLGTKLFFTNMTDRDIISHGAEERLDRLLDHCAETGPDDQVIILENTCIPKILGQDLRQVGDEFAARSRTPLLQSHPGQAWNTHLGGIAHMYRDLLAHAAPAGDVEAHAINLVGFNPGKGLDELTGLLAEVGVSVNSRVFPTLDLNHVRRYRKAAFQIFRDCAALDELYDAVFVPSGLPVLRPPLPFGIDASRRFVGSIAGALGLGEAWEALWAARSDAILSEHQSLCNESRSLRVGFVCDIGQVSRLWNPERTLGLNLMGWLCGFGVGVDILLYEPTEDAHFRQAVSQELGLIFAEQGGETARLRTSYFAGREQMQRELAQSSGAVFFSEYTGDPRLHAAGKAGFSLLDIEMGFEGSLRSIRRLLTKAKAPYYRALVAGRNEEHP